MHVCRSVCISADAESIVLYMAPNKLLRITSGIYLGPDIEKPLLVSSKNNGVYRSAELHAYMGTCANGLNSHYYLLPSISYFKN